VSLRESSRLGSALYYGSLGAVALLAGGRLAGREASPWPLVAAFAAGTALVAGPLAWLARDRLPEERRRRFGYVAAGAALFSVPFVLGIGLLSGGLIRFLDAAASGGVIGLLVAAAGRAVVPDHRRGGGS